MSDAVKIDGLTQFVKRLKEVDAELPKTLRKTFNTVADIVVTSARSGFPTRTGRAKSSIRVASAQDKVRVSAGGAKAPWYPWIDYGGEGRRRGRPPARPFIKKGRFLYPGYYKVRDSGEFEEMLNTALGEVVKAAGLEVD
jgi:hypothetical protein